MKLNIKKAIWVILGTLCFSIALGAAINQFAKGHGDNAFLMEVTESLGNLKGPYTESTASTSIALPTWTLHAEQVCTKDFNLPPEPLNYFKHVHPYLILYILAPLKNLFGANNLLALLMALSFFVLGFFLLYKINISGVPIIVSILFIHLLISHPAWIGGLEGQAYIDRIFVLVGGLLFWFILKTPVGPSNLILILGVIAAILNDRTGIQASIFVGAYGMFYWKDKKNAKWYIPLGILLFSFSFCLIYYYVKGYGSTSATTSQLSNIISVIRALDEKTISLFLFAFLILGPWSLKYGRLMLIALASIAPNILVSVGGAEKTGWYTHYHSGYLPVIVAISAYCFCEEYLNSSKKMRRLYISYIMIATIVIMSAPRDLSVSKTAKFSWDNSAFKRTYQLWLDKPEYENQLRSELRKLIPAGATVSTSELSYKYIWNHARYFYFPSGIDQADYILMTKSTEFDVPTAAWSYLDLESKRALHACLWERVSKTHTKHIAVPGFPYILLSR